jgi:DMSO reductase anchor subunit
MHPSFSVVFFTACSGAGYGLWLWLGLIVAAGRSPPPMAALAALLVGFVLVTAGLLSSTAHLGKPLRAWRAFSQWRTSWLSREGIAALATYLPMLWLAWVWWNGGSAPRAAGVLLALGAIATVVCTAMIYASLKPIPAWRHPLVLPTYLVFALHTGLLAGAATLALAGAETGNMAGLLAIVFAFLLWRLKRITWQWIDAGALPVTRNSALGLPAERSVRVFERPHTEANYLTKEMGFVLARKHAKALRAIALVLFTLLPALLALPVWLLPHLDTAPWLLAGAVCALAGAFVERWLFFAQARHLVTLYY